MISKVQFGDVQALVFSRPENDPEMESLWYTKQDFTVFRGERKAEEDANRPHNSASDRARRQNYIQSILTLQEEHKDTGIQDVKGLAALSLTLSKEHKKEAKEQATKDSIEVYGFVRAPPRRCVSNEERAFSRLKAMRNSSGSGSDSDGSQRQLPSRSKSATNMVNRRGIGEKVTKKTSDTAPRRVPRRTNSESARSLREAIENGDAAPRRVPRRTSSGSVRSLQQLRRTSSADKDSEPRRALRRTSSASETARSLREALRDVREAVVNNGVVEEDLRETLSNIQQAIINKNADEEDLREALGNIQAAISNKSADEKVTTLTQRKDNKLLNSSRRGIQRSTSSSSHRRGVQRTTSSSTSERRTIRRTASSSSSGLRRSMPKPAPRALSPIPAPRKNNVAPLAA